jgi:hypothetical protein
MTARTTKRTVTFAHPFKLEASGAEFPAGRYFIETDEELVDGPSFPVYRRTATMMQLIANPLRPGSTETAVIDPLQLEMALEADSARLPQAEPEEPAAPSLVDTPRESGSS